VHPSRVDPQPEVGSNGRRRGCGDGGTVFATTLFSFEYQKIAETIANQDQRPRAPYQNLRSAEVGRKRVGEPPIARRTAVRTAPFLGLSGAPWRAESVRLGKAGGGRDTGVEHSPAKWQNSNIQLPNDRCITDTVASRPSLIALLRCGSCDPHQPEGRPLDRHRRCGCAKQPDCPISRRISLPSASLRDLTGSRDSRAAVRDTGRARPRLGLSTPRSQESRCGRAKKRDWSAPRRRASVARRPSRPDGGP
jgi:hypothetical protein